MSRTGARLMLALAFLAIGLTWTPVSGYQSRLARLEGLVSNERGEPLTGAVVSIFGDNLTGGGLITFTDETGRFLASDLPSGLYILRAYLAGFLPSGGSKVEVRGTEVVPATIALSLASSLGQEGGVEEEGRPAAEGLEGERRLAELKWLLRRARRNILQSQEAGLVLEDGPTEKPRGGQVPAGWGLDFDGELGIFASASELGLDDFLGAGGDLDGRLAYVRLGIPTGAGNRWLVSARVVESALSSWAARAEFISQRAGQELSAGVAYGHHFYGGLADFRSARAGLEVPPRGERAAEWFGSAFGEHGFHIGPARVGAGLSYHHYSYLDRSGYFAPRVEVEWTADGREASKTVVRGTIDYRVLAPAGEDVDLLTRMVSADFVGWTDSIPRGLQAERTLRYQLEVERRLSATSAIELRLFHEAAEDQLVKTYLGRRSGAGLGPGHYQVANRGDFRARGIGLALSKRFGMMAGSVGYTFGQGTAIQSAQAAPYQGEAEDEVHDLTTTLETEIDRTRTRVYAVYKLSNHFPLVRGGESTERAILDSRFNVQVHQGLPFLGSNSTEWEVLLAVRNLFYRDLESVSFLDEISVIDSPRRVLGGVSVRF